MSMTFPSSPTTGQQYSVSGGPTYTWDGSVWKVLTPGQQYSPTIFTATAGQTTFTISGGYVIGAIDVFKNGVKLVNGQDYAATDLATVVLSAACSAGDSVEIITLAQILYSQALKKTGDTMTGDLAVPNLSYTGSLTGGTGVIAIGTNQIYKDAAGNVGIGVTPVAGSGKVQVSGANNSPQMLIGPYGSRTYSYNTRANGSYDNAWLDVVSNSSVGGYTWQNGGGTLLTLDLNGVLQLDKGQIKFPVTQSASSDANTLDDYEEGTWTPVDSSGASLTLSVNGAQYIKIGQMVWLYCYVTYPTTSNALTASIGGLPFTSISGAYPELTVRPTSGVSSGIVAQISSAATTLVMYAVNSGGPVPNSSLSTQGVLVTGCYRANN